MECGHIYQKGTPNWTRSSSSVTNVQQKKVATGSISKLTVENLDGSEKVQDIQFALEGQVTGLVVKKQSSGQPGANKSLLIRGISTNGDNSPLYIVDGLQVSGIGNISPGDVESVDVLKDAASSAIYGARAANGVVIITTKKGTSGDRDPFPTKASIRFPIPGNCRKCLTPTIIS